ncbi:(d)CMP kinase [Amycolatopsis magusensis]|uniref:(d)CMP kinase n=1 Tax=Amycolatopsis magusensis TaxID=882444 RepID=UPI00378A8CAD
MAGVLRGVIALDGPSGTGKTTAARGLATRLGSGYLDTGAMYRVIALAVLRAGADPADPAAVLAVAERTELTVGTDPAGVRVLLDGEDVAAAIRGGDVDHAVSPVSAVPEVRARLVDEQRRIIAEVLAARGGIVVDGRDIGTVVAPDAPLKVFLTASPEARAARRSAEHGATGVESTVESVRAAVDRRDRLDSTRAASPLRAAEDAVGLDTSDLDREQVITTLTGLARERGLLDQVGAEALR